MCINISISISIYVYIYIYICSRAKMKSHKSEIRNQFHDKVLLPAKIIYSLLENAYLLNL